MKTTKQLTEREAIAVGVGLPISKKSSLEISNFIKGKSVKRAKKILEDVIEMKIAIPCKKIRSVGHRKGIGPGNYPIKAATFILKIVKSAESNANTKGLNVDNLIIKTIIPNQGSRSYHYGRRRGLKTKSTHIEIIVEEVTQKKEEKVVKKESTKPVEKEIKTETENKTEKEPVEKEIKKEEEKKTETTPIEKKIEEKTETPKEKPEEIKK